MTDLSAPPVLSTPDNHILDEAQPPPTIRAPDAFVSDEEIYLTYEIERTVKEIKQGRWKRVALQFPDEMLVDATRVYGLLQRGLKEVKNDVVKETEKKQNTEGKESVIVDDTVKSVEGLKIEEKAATNAVTDKKEEEECIVPELFILADTSYGACCVDEVAAEHVNADVAVHYGRSCLSPTSRLPVIYVFTQSPLDLDACIATFKETYPETDSKIIIAADVTYSSHIEPLCTRLLNEGYTTIFGTSVVHNPSSPLPNRTIPSSVETDPSTLTDWQLFHIADPPTSLLLTLSSRVAAIHIYPTSTITSSQPTTTSTSTPKPLLSQSTAMILRRRYALLTSLTTVPIFGILINTLSVKNYLPIISHLQSQIAAAGKKSYLFVVGKLNAAKVANFSEVGGWVVVGCWESSLVDSRDFWRPVITPFELGLCLRGDESRVWTGAWEADYQRILDQVGTEEEDGNVAMNGEDNASEETKEGQQDQQQEEDLSDEESAPPEFDLRTGRYVSHSRPMQSQTSTSTSTPTSNGPSSTSTSSTTTASSKSLTKRLPTHLTTINGVISPGAEFLKAGRSWTGLGSDFTVGYEEDGEEGGASTAIEEGRRGVARGYVVGDREMERH